MMWLRLPKSQKARQTSRFWNALNEKRVLITEDRDFGELVYARGRSSAGVILVRFPSRARRAKPETVVEAVAKCGSRLRDAFTVLEPGRARISGRP
jgi:hypothetical protein